MKKKLLRKFITLALGTSLIAGLVGCGNASVDNEAEVTEETVATTETEEEKPSSNGETLEVHLGDQPSFFILKIAEYNGYFDEEFADTGVKIVVDNFVNQGSAIVEAMNAGDVQLGVLGTMPLVTADANGSGFVGIASVNLSIDGFKLYAGKDTGISSVSDFKGKKIAVKFSSNEHEMLLTLLANAGLSDSDVEIINMSAADRETSWMRQMQVEQQL